MKINDEKLKEIGVTSSDEYGWFYISINNYKVKVFHDKLKELMEEITSAQYKNASEYFETNKKGE